jgi:hypothetical protein
MLVLGAFAALGAPAIAEVASKPSPSVAALQAVLNAGISPSDVYVTEPLRAHADEYFKYTAHVVSETVPTAVPRAGVFVGADDRPFGVVPQRVFAFETPRLVHISRGRYLRVEIFEGKAGAGVFVPEVTPPGWQLGGRVELPEGSTLTVRSATPADVAFTGNAAGDGASAEIRTSGKAFRTPVAAGHEGAASFRAAPDASRILFSITAERGSVTLDGFRIVARER